jgi:hypothetical protein
MKEREQVRYKNERTLHDQVIHYTRHVTNIYRNQWLTKKTNVGNENIFIKYICNSVDAKLNVNILFLK